MIYMSVTGVGGFIISFSVMLLCITYSMYLIKRNKKYDLFSNNNVLKHYFNHFMSLCLIALIF